MEKQKRKGTLGRILNFTPGDLDANKAGFITHRQRRQLLRLCVFSQEFFWYPGFVIFFWWIGIYAALNTSLSLWVRIGASIVPALLGLGIAYGPFWIAHLQPFVQDFHNRKVLRVHLPKGQGYYQVGESRFYIGYWQQDALNKDDDYWLYIAPMTKTILSAEVASE